MRRKEVLGSWWPQLENKPSLTINCNKFEKIERLNILSQFDNKK